MLRTHNICNVIFVYLSYQVPAKRETLYISHCGTLLDAEFLGYSSNPRNKQAATFHPYHQKVYNATTHAYTSYTNNIPDLLNQPVSEYLYPF